MTKLFVVDTCTVCGFPLTKKTPGRVFTCENCQLDLFPGVDYKRKEPPVYYHEGDGIIRERTKTDESNTGIQLAGRG
jgi:uncharacterized Zn finger protein (UPF0148 family)